jgi:hypothetical protein
VVADFFADSYVYGSSNRSGITWLNRYSTSCQTPVALDDPRASSSGGLTGLANARATMPTINIATTIKNELSKESVES